jgi:nitrite reductase (cytochrome c-552)
MRILGDASMYAGKADGLLRQALTKAGVEVPVKVDLELPKYLNNRGVKKLMFRPEQELKDPYGDAK